MVTRAAVPSSQSRIRAKLYHAEWHGRTRESVTVTAGADERIYVSCWVPLAKYLDGHLKQQEQRNEKEIESSHLWPALKFIHVDSMVTYSLTCYKLQPKL